MELKKIFKGIAVVIDDEIFKKNDSDIKTIVNEIENNYDIKFLKLKDIPKNNSDGAVGSVEALSEAVLVILDWKLSSTFQESSDGTGFVPKGDTLIAGEDSSKIELIQKLLRTSFAPIFVFTNNQSVARFALENSDVSKYLDGRLIVEDKRNVKDAKQIQRCLTTWLENNHESYVLKEWEVKAEKAKHDFFQSFGPDDVSWVDALWKRLKIDDDAECSTMLGEYITRCIVNNMEDIVFDENILAKTNQSVEKGNEVLKKLVNIETVKWSKGKDFPVHPHAGDMFYSKNKDHEKFFLNIRADCDFSRNSDNTLYFIEGRPLMQKEFEGYKNKIDEDGIIRFAKTEGLDPSGFTDVDEVLKKDEIQINNIPPLLKQRHNLEYINLLFNQSPKVINAHGKLLGHRNQFYLPISGPGSYLSGKFKELNDMIAIKFTFELTTMRYKELKKLYTNNARDNENAYEPIKFVGKLLPPYINEIQEECAHWIFRTGTMPTPDEFYVQPI